MLLRQARHLVRRDLLAGLRLADIPHHLGVGVECGDQVEIVVGEPA
jgi:hypothetical protein